MVVTDVERGLRTRSGRLVAWLEPGRHWVFWPREGNAVTKLDLRRGWAPWTPELAAVVPASAATVVDVPHRAVAIVTVDGRPTDALSPGRYLLWQLRAVVAAQVYAADGVYTAIPEVHWPFVPPEVLAIVEVAATERVILCVDGVFVGVLAPGRYGVNAEDRKVAVTRVDVREQELSINGQDVLTSDNVTVRINLHVRYKVVDPRRMFDAIADGSAGLYAEAQLAARRAIAGRTLDQLLADRAALAAALPAEVGAVAEGWGVSVSAVDLKDIILPGELKAVLSQVIEAEKRAAANVILRREETSATRSLANTAKLLEQNPMLLRLKELESLERVADKVGSIHVVATQEKLLGTLKLDG